MGNLLYGLAMILLIIWAVGFLAFQAGGLIHVLPALAVYTVLLRIVQGRKPL